MLRTAAGKMGSFSGGFTGLGVWRWVDDIIVGSWLKPPGKWPELMEGPV